MDSGTTHLNSWISHKRNVRGDFREQFGEDILSIDVVALMADTDNSGHGDEGLRNPCHASRRIADDPARLKPARLLSNANGEGLGLSASWMPLFELPGNPGRAMDDFCFQLVKLVRALRDVDGPLAEHLATVARIGPGNGEDWYREWRVQADACRARADAELAHGYIQTAKSNWLQASVYYRTAGAFLSADDERNRDLLSAAENCSDNYMRSMQPAGEIVDMPCGGRRTIRGYFLRAPHSLRRSPVVVCFGGTGETKDELLGTMPRFAFARGLSLLIVDDQGGSRDRAGDRSRRNIEKAVGRCVDYLSGRDDVDRNRIALFGNNFGAIHASRIASLDHRFAAVVCDGGIWEERGRPLLSSWAVGGHVPKLPRYAMARRLKCPFLVTSGDYEFLDPEAATRLHEYSIKAKLQMELRLFSSTDAGSPRRAFIFDWLATKIAEDVSRGSAEQSFHLPRAARSGKRPREH